MLEQTLRDELERQNNKDTVGLLLKLAKKKKILSKEAEQAAEDLKTMRNEVIHRRFEALEDEALNAMEQLGVVLQELGQRSAQ